MRKIEKHGGNGVFMLQMAVFVVLLGSMVVVLAGMSNQTKVVLNGQTEKVDAVDEASKSLDMVGNVDAKSDLQMLDSDISGL